MPHECISCAGSARIITAYKTLLVIQKILEYYMFCVIKPHLELDNKKIQKLSSKLTDAITLAIRHTKEASRRLEDNSVLMFFVNLFKYNQDNVIAYTPEEFFASNSKCIFYYDFDYFFRGEDILSYMKSCSFKISNKKLPGELKSLGWLRTRKGESSYPLPKKLRYKYDQESVRYYRISGEALNAAIKDHSDNVLELFGSHLKKYT
jgi:hypothetical protein